MRDNLDYDDWLTFDDVLIVPGYSDIKSRKDCNTHVSLHAGYLGEDIGFNLPVISANMDSITGIQMANRMGKLGGIGIIHRYMRIEDMLYCYSNCHNLEVFFSVGTLDNDKERIDTLIKLNEESQKLTSRIHLCVDIAHGHSENMRDTVEYIRYNGFFNLLIGGNVATEEAVSDLMKWGCDVVKVGIGPGGVCSTRTKTGVGVPQFEAIKNCASVENAQIIADGGFKHIGDFAKAIGAGAKMCMTGSFFAGTDCTPFWTTDELIPYRGMASEEAQKQFKGKFSNAEGISTFVKNKGIGSTNQVCLDIQEGLKSSMSYVGARTISEFQSKCKFIRVSPNVSTENSTRL
jgi:IMP dehydrogenase